MEAVNDGLKILDVVPMLIQSSIKMHAEPTESDIRILELTHGASFSVNMITTLSIRSVVVKTCDRFGS